MRTTLNVDDDVYEAARALAESERQPIGRILSRLARRGLAPARVPGRRRRRGFPVVALPDDSPPVTPDTVRRALEEEDE
jgi:hypothetical protein